MIAHPVNVDPQRKKLYVQDSINKKLSHYSLVKSWSVWPWSDLRFDRFPFSGLCPWWTGSGCKRAHPERSGDLCQTTVCWWSKLASLFFFFFKHCSAWWCVLLTCPFTTKMKSNIIGMKCTHRGFRWTGARLQLFGSSKNGFGFRQSDLDICMVLEGQETMDVSYHFNTLLVLFTSSHLRRHFSVVVVSYASASSVQFNIT